MKRWLALFVALALLGACALAEPMSYLDYTDDVLEDGSLVYDFPELSLRLPASWRGAVMALREEGATGFYQKASYDRYLESGIEGGGFLFRLGASVNGSFSQLPSFHYLGYSEASSLNYYLEYPTDYPAWNEESVRAEYDAMYAQLDFVAANAEFYPGVQGGESGDPAPSAAADDQPGDGAAPEGGISLERARYHFEHSALPRYFYEAPETVLSVLNERGAYGLWRALADENGVRYPYTEGDYGTRLYQAEDGTDVLQIVMPKPEANTQCYRVYMVYNPAAGIAGYYTIEYDDLLGETALTCGWTSDLTHVNYAGAQILDPLDDGYPAALEEEAGRIAELAGASGSFIGEGAGDSGEDAIEDPNPAGLSRIECPEQGFAILADPAFAWDYQQGTGITVYTQGEGHIPYIIVWRGEDLLAEPFEYIREQYTPHMQKQYGDDLVHYEEYEAYPIGGKTLPAGVYTYRLQGYLIDMIRAYDSAGSRTVAYTAKYIQGQGEATLSALHDAVRSFEATDD